MRRSVLAPSVAVAALLAVAAAPARADHHFMRIVQVYGGDVSHPDAQYVELKMCTGFQNAVAGHDVGFYAADGTILGTATPFTQNVPNFATQSSILIATSTAEAVFGVTADLNVPADLLTAGGKFCFETSTFVDCFAWGAYTPIDSTVGTPFNQGGGGLLGGQSARRDQNVAGTSALDCIGATNDDTGNSANDFDADLTPDPRNNAGTIGGLNADLIFAHGLENGSTTGWSSTVP